MRRYGQLLAILATFLFFSGVDLYLFMADLASVTPRDWVTLFALLLTPVLLYRLHVGDVFDRRSALVFLWCGAYVGLSLLWYSTSPSQAGLQELRDRSFAAAFLGLMAAVFHKPEYRRIAATGVLIVVVATCIINGIQTIRPDWFYMSVHTRASGLYGNPNQCGAALIIGMIVAAPLLSPRFRYVLYLAVVAGLIMTFSRSSMVGFLMASVILAVVNERGAKVRDLVAGMTTAAALALVLLHVAAPSGLTKGVSLDTDQTERVSFFKTFETSDAAAQERKDVAEKAWTMFLERPFAGSGLASTVTWTERSSTHNMFLYFLADHGIVGVLILPALLFGVILARPDRAAGSHWAFCAFTLWYAFFSHNILTEQYYLFGFAFFAMGGLGERPRATSAATHAARAFAPPGVDLKRGPRLA
jgi:hypothetical protein